MRIAYLNPCGQLGGAETSLLQLLASLRQAVPDWELFLALGEDGPLAAEARLLGVEVAILPFPAAVARLGDCRTRPVAMALRLAAAATASFRYKLGLARLLKTVRPDVIHTNGFKMHLFGAWARPRSASLVWHIHDYVSTRTLMSRLLRLFGTACSVAVVNSNSVARDLGSIAPRLPVVPIYNAVDTQRFSPRGMKLDLDALSGLPPAGPETVRIGLVSTFAKWKGHKVFIGALSRLHPDLPIRAYIIGAPIYQTEGSQWSRQELEQEAARHGLGGKLGFTGFIRDTASAMRSLDIVVHASTEPEPFGMVIIEGMASSKPVIASRAGGAAELIEDGKTALGHAPGNEQELAEHMDKLVRDAALRQRLGQAGRSAAERLYNGKILVDKLLPLYRQTVEGIRGDQVPDAAPCALHSVNE